MPAKRKSFWKNFLVGQTNALPSRLKVGYRLTKFLQNSLTGIYIFYSLDASEPNLFGNRELHPNKPTVVPIRIEAKDLALIALHFCLFLSQ